MAVCVYCKNEGSNSLGCKQHVICQECLPKNIDKFGYKDGALYTCPECVGSTAPRMRNVWIFADNSNIWIEAMKHTAERKGFTPTLDHDHRVRIDYGGCLHPDNLAGKNRVVKKATLYGSVPPPVDTFWEKVRTYKWVVKTYERSYVTHKEKEVDTELVADVTEVVCKTPVHLRGTIIIISGDRDMRPAVEKALENGFEVEMYIWKNATSFRDSLNMYSKKYPGCVSYQFLDNIEAQATYLNKESSESQQDNIHNCSAVISIGQGKTPEEIVGSKEHWNDLEKLTKWPVEYRLLKDGDKNRHLLLVFQGMEKPDLESLVEKLNSLPYVEHCRLFTKSLEKTGVIDDDDGFKKIVGGIKPKKPGAISCAKLPPPARKTAQSKVMQKCCSGKNCDKGKQCKFGHTGDDLRYFRRREGAGNTKRKTSWCKNILKNGVCKYSDTDCDYAHAENDRWCTNCHKSGHFAGKNARDCPNPKCQHPSHL
jgi:uncharacterized LabA/DUF88 family protein